MFVYVHVSRLHVCVRTLAGYSYNTGRGGVFVLQEPAYMMEKEQKFQRVHQNRYPFVIVCSTVEGIYFRKRKFEFYNFEVGKN